MIFHLVAHFPSLIDWERKTTAIYHIIILYDTILSYTIIILHYHIIQPCIISRKSDVITSSA